MRKEIENIEVGSSIQLQFQRNQLPLENIFKEFIDNSLQSYRTPENQKKLNEIGISKCTVTIKITQDSIVIHDNAFGMNHEAFKRALRLNKKADKYAEGSLGEFGMGLKYAAISLGDEYTIETSALGSNEKYKATINRELLSKDSKFVENEIEENFPETEHFTKITISNLIKQLTVANRDKLINDLSKIYHKYLENEDLEIFFSPNHPVKYNPPQIWVNEDGSELQEDFEGSFTYNEKEYIYYGWIGILNKADTSKTGDAGFSLLKNGRIIINNYRPESLVGKGNSFQYQRIVGEINLDDWPVDFNKGSFTWNDGLQETFIEYLKKNSTVSKFIKKSKELRKTDKSKIPPKEKQQKTLSSIEKKFMPLSTKKRVSINEPSDDPTIKPAYATLDAETYPIKIEYEGTVYTFNTSYGTEQDATKKWLILENISSSNNEYYLKINNNFDLFSKSKTNESELMQTFAVIIALSEISSIRAGYKESHKFVNKINEIIKLIK